MTERYVLQFRDVSEAELLSEAEALDPTPYRPFLAPWEHESPYRAFEVVRARLTRVIRGSAGQPLNRKPFVIETPRGQALLWRAIPGKVEVVLCQQQSGGQWVLQADQVVTLSEEEWRHCQIRLDRIVVNPPSWL
ncbi:hypothetical protein [Thermogemmatispora onikobensis]|uniref:hypothetical protein n=1 Tax=Thermogemmatispora onikobensis TaxID=732234 RepID=UPI00114D07BF|nr:hypothetical protein [Thermogemmatispora onikobensis]